MSGMNKTQSNKYTEKVYMDLTQTEYSEFSKTSFPQVSNTSSTNQQPSLTNYIAPNDNFYSLPVSYPIKPARVPRSAPSVDEEVAGYPLPITPTSVEGYVNIDDIKADSYVDLTKYKMNYSGHGSLNDILQKLREANVPIGVPKPEGGYAIYEGFAELDEGYTELDKGYTELDKGYTEESILYNHDSVISRFYIGSLSVVGLLILYRMMRL